MRRPAHELCVLFALAFLLLSTATIGAPRTTIFRDGDPQNPSYVGTRDVQLSAEVSSVWDPNANYASHALMADGRPIDKAALMRWDVSAIPRGSTINAARISLHALDESSSIYPLHALFRSWDEATVTANHASTGVPWSLAGAEGVGTDRDDVVLGSIGPVSARGAVTFDLDAAGLEQLKAWVEGTRPNHGFIVSKYTNTDGIDWANGAATTLSSRPMLTVTYNGTETISFQQGVAPSSAYTGFSGTTIANGRGPGNESWDGDFLEVGRSAERAFLLAFDVSAIPRGSAVVSASLLFYSRNPAIFPVPVYPQLRAWTESEASWNLASAGHPWEVPGNSGATDHEELEVAVIPEHDGGFLEVPLAPVGIERVQSWIDGERPNHGFFAHATTVPEGAQVILHHREVSTIARRPGLAISWTPGALRVDPGSAEVAPGTQLALTPFGGVGRYSWTMTEAPSGGTLTAAGLYTAGAKGGVVDRIRLEDGEGAQAEASVSVIASPILPGGEPDVVVAAALVAPPSGARPGAEVRLLTHVTNRGSGDSGALRVRLTLEGLTLALPLPASFSEACDCFELGSMGAESSTTMEYGATVTTVDGEARATLVLESDAGELSRSSAAITVTPLGVDVGCGCGASDPAPIAFMLAAGALLLHRTRRAAARPKR